MQVFAVTACGTAAGNGPEPVASAAQPAPAAQDSSLPAASLEHALPAEEEEEPVQATTVAVSSPASPELQPEAQRAQDSSPAAASAQAAFHAAACAEQQPEPCPGSQPGGQASGESRQAQDASQDADRAGDDGDEVSQLLSLLLPGRGALLPSAKPAAHETSTAAAATALQQSPWPQGACSGSRAEEQRALRGFVEECCKAGTGSKEWDGAMPPAHAGSAAQQRAVDGSSPFPPGSTAQRLFLRMGSSPTAAALLRGLLCPLTQVRFVHVWQCDDRGCGEWVSDLPPWHAGAAGCCA